MAKLKIYTASAGAGKTHALTREYLRLALSKERGYRRIQAVTFTNKATGEMKERILRELYSIASQDLSTQPYKSPFLEELADELSLPLGEVQKRASGTLRGILSDYSSFRISTIDAFFQEVLRAFARELGLQGNFRVDMENELALSRAVNAVLSDFANGEIGHDLKEWIQDYSLMNLEQGESYDLRRSLVKLSRTILTEEVKKLIQEKKLPTRTELKALRQKLHQYIDQFTADIAERARRVMQTLEGVGYTVEDTSYKEKGGLSLVLSLDDKAKVLQFVKEAKPKHKASPRFLKACEDVESLFAKSSKEARARILTSSMQADLLSLQTALDKGFVEAVSAQLVLGELNSYGLITDIERKLAEEQRSAGSMLLADAPSLIYSIIQDPSGLGLIYEKIGTRIEHQMIDEFQDTSGMQYLNFLPLLRESLASGNDNLVVGDVKQSIYRWRGSESHLLGRQIIEDFPLEGNPLCLRENWRSTPEIIHFNNALYQSLAKAMADNFRSVIETEGVSNQLLQTEGLAEGLARAFIDNYKDVGQLVPTSRADRCGVVAIHRYSKDIGGDEESESDTTPLSLGVLGRLEEDSSIAYQLPRLIVDLQKRGYKASDIAILVRRRAEAQMIAQLLDESTKDDTITEGGRYSLGYISDEALRIDRALSVRFIIALLSCIALPTDTLSRLTAKELWKMLTKTAESTPQELSDSYLDELPQIGKRSLYETIEALIGQHRTHFPQGEIPYLVGLLDLALGYQQDLSVDIRDFLKMWQETGAMKTLRIAEDDDKLYLMTIHKSKGLGFPIVLVPLPTWSLDQSALATSYLWCPSPYGEQSTIPMLPLAYSSKLMQSHFASKYLEEKQSLALDALNMLYVTTTRAKNELHIWMPEEGEEEAKEQDPTKFYKTIEVPLAEFLRSARGLYIDILPEKSGEERPQLPQNNAQEEGSDSRKLTINDIESVEVGQRIEVLRRGLRHFEDNSRRAFGSLMHHILDRVETFEDLDKAIDDAEREGFIPSDQREEAYWATQQMLSLPQARPWFDGSGRILRETPILGGGLETSRRPDRVVLYPDGSADVIDYKFGEARKAHHRQVADYVRLIKTMGYAPVQGFLWYVSAERIEEVTLS